MAVESEMVSEAEREEKELREKRWVSLEVSKESRVDPETGVRGTGGWHGRARTWGWGTIVSPF